MKKRKLTYSNFYFYLMLVMPLLVIYVVFFIIPVIQSLFFSFTNFNGLKLDVRFIGPRNYQVAFTDEEFWKTLVNTFLIAIGVTLLQNGLALVFAMGLNRSFKGRGLVRTLVFAPCMLAPVVVAYLWQFIYSPEGLINTLTGLDVVWLANKKFALACVIIAHSWIWVGYSATIFLADMQGISTDIMEAADMDGCGPWQRFKGIVWPMIAVSTTVNISLSFMGSLKIFDLVYAMTGGGPNGATETMGTYVMKKMGANLHGYASGLTIIMTILIVISGGIITRALKKREEVLY